jgi:hypothetical protein
MRVNANRAPHEAQILGIKTWKLFSILGKRNTKKKTQSRTINMQPTSHTVNALPVPCGLGLSATAIPSSLLLQVFHDINISNLLSQMEKT